MDTLKQFIEDYNDGIISVYDLQRRLDFDDWVTSRQQKPISIDYIQLPLNPLDIILEKERLNNIKDVLLKLKKVLTDSQWKIMVLLSQGKTQKDIAEELEVTQPNISQKIYKIRKKISALGINLKEMLEKPSPTYEASSPKIMIRYPMDFARRKIVDGKIKCCLPEYIKYDCGFDNTVCCCCDREKCTRKLSNPIKE